ncbi:MAG: DegT/DnrJ/EryC1/StrS family aminotransferase [Thermodesulfobacteriota bacterium]
MRVPLLDLSAQLAPLREEVLEAVTRVVDSTRYIQGPEVTALEEEVAAYCGTSHGVGVSSGTDALLVSLLGLDIEPGDKVLTTPYTFFATMGVILRRGAVPVFVDIDPVTFNMDPQAMADALDNDKKKQIKAIIPVHLYGQCADMEKILDAADSHGAAVIEDAAQAIGAEYPGQKGADDWRRAGSMGLCGCFSFFPSKNLGGIGDGGMVVTDDGEFAQKLRILLNHGASPKYYHSMIGGNFRLDPIQAAVLRIKLRHLDEWHRGRRKNAASYNDLFSETGLVEKGMVQLPAAVYLPKDNEAEEPNHHIYNQYILRVKERDELVKWLHDHSVGCEIYYPLSLHRQECLKGHYEHLDLPNSDRAAAETIALPIYPEVGLENQQYVVETIAKFYNR